MDPEWVDVFPIEHGDVIPASYVSLPEGNSSHLKMDGWNMIKLPFGAFGPILQGQICR